jgi:heptaprenyl diphosphate synthase
VCIYQNTVVTLQESNLQVGFMEVTSTEIQYEIKPAKIKPKGSKVFELVEKGIEDAIASGEGTIQQMCAHIAGSGGKRIRPRLVLSSGMAFSRVTPNMINVAVAAELIHMASLVHDDIIDKSPLRRSKPSVNKLWGNHAAVLCGDWLFAKAFGILAGKGLSASMGFMVEAIQNMCHGEILQAINNFKIDISLESYYKQITKKTANLLECCCKAGAATGGAGSTGIDAMGEFGLNIGLAFQIIDDILDLCGNAGMMGKPKGEDLRQGIITLPVILLLRDESCGASTRELLAKRTFTSADISAVNKLLLASGVIDEAYEIAGAFIDKAQNSLALLPDSQNKQFLVDLAAGLRRREA